MSLTHSLPSRLSSADELCFPCSLCLQSLSMTSVDLCAMYKPWLVQESVVSTIMDEFWQEVCLFSFLHSRAKENERDEYFRLHSPVSPSSFLQGDEEKRRGIQPQSLMDRSLAHELPKNQVSHRQSERVSGTKLVLGEFHQEYLSAVLFFDYPGPAGNHAHARWSEVSERSDRIDQGEPF